ncbi:FAD-binding oxidoreductase [Pseudalkalibacillus caeni]|uniref:FAD-binding oxidoreductase n=1 Tax=Exobacillus caeni TaxID=2574798 RepID=A0A5R9F8I0_9BACL|nr:FAD-binding oxidoreductase [Pseudalkalibacillus caeni]TLS36824.1 FAD-binding oxidoreductase [Pseudalkalibacillus caeni]
MRIKSNIAIILFLIGYGSFFLYSVSQEKTDSKSTISDVSGLMPVKVKRVVKGNEEKSFINTVKEANEKDLKVSIAGKMHSQGGHTYYEDAVVMDTTGYNEILKIDPEKKIVRVQSGATWDDIQQAINPYGLSIKVMQSQNIFTIGGSLSVNVHGRDIRNGSLIETVKSFRLLKPDGEVITVSRTENGEYFPLVIGGYGLFGMILDVEIELTNDELYQMRTKQMDYKDYPSYFKKNVKGNKNVRMHLARISTSPDSFLKDMYVTDYELAEKQEDLKNYNELKSDRGTWLTKPLLGLSRDFDWGKEMFWKLQNKYFEKKDGSYVSRNNSMRSESEFLEYKDEENTDILQEYFVPVDEFSSYIEDLRGILSEEEFNLVNITIRYVGHNEDAVLSFAKDDMFALVLLINQGIAEEDKKQTQKVVRKMIGVTLEHGGSYYLPYYSYPTKEQMKLAYPRTEEFFSMKRKLDPEERFVNMFYEEYGK